MGQISKIEMFDFLRELWGNEVLKGTRSCHENMKSRCGNGYEVLDSAFQKFDNFLLHMGPRPGPKFSIDRIDNSKGYSPCNCRWADKPTQTRNRSNTVMLTCDGKTLPLGEWADLQGESARVLHARRAKGLSDYEVVHGERPVIRPFGKYWPPKSWDELEAAAHACCRWPNDERRELRDFIRGEMNRIGGQAEYFAVLEEEPERMDAKALEVERKWTDLYCRYRDLLKAVDRIPNKRFD